MMHALDEALGCWPPGSVSSVVHIGAGSGSVLPLYATLRPQQALLVEGDPRHGDALRAAAAEHPFAEVLVRAVSATGGDLTWHRTTLPALDGPLDMQALQTYYPRLRLLERLPLVSVPVVDIVIQRPGSGTGQALLVLDVPGQEDALLAALGAHALRDFDACILCGCNGVPGTPSARAAVQRLQAGGAEIAWSNEPREPLWPLTMLRTPRGLARERDLAGVAASTAVPSVPAASGSAQSPELERLSRENEALRVRLSAAEAAQHEKLRQLEAAQARERQRHDALQQQLVDAEAQIALLKDLLLRETPP
jgi:hypothetical protein